LPNSLFSQNSDSLLFQKIDSLFGFSLDSLDVLLREDKIDSLGIESLYEIMNALNEEDELNDLIEAKLPFFSLEDTDGNVFTSSLLEGKPTVIHFWSISHQSSIDQIPLMDSLRRYYDNSVNIIAITSYSKIDIAPYIYNYNYNVTHLVNANEYKKSIGVRSTPKIIVIDKGLIVKKIYKMESQDSHFKDTYNSIKKLISSIQD